MKDLKQEVGILIEKMIEMQDKEAEHDYNRNSLIKLFENNVINKDGNLI